MQDTEPVIMKYVALIATGAGEYLPAIIGRASLQMNNAVIMMDRSGNQMLALPGAGGYTVNWAPGVLLLPLSASRSKHITLRCDHYEGNPNPSAHTVLMAERLRNHTLDTEKRAEPPADGWTYVQMPEGEPSSSSTRPTTSATTDRSKSRPPTTIPLDMDNTCPLQWPAFQKKWKGYPSREVQVAYAAQWRMVPRPSDDERRRAFADLYPMLEVRPRSAPAARPAATPNMSTRTADVDTSSSTDGGNL